MSARAEMHLWNPVLLLCVISASYRSASGNAMQGISIRERLFLTLQVIAAVRLQKSSPLYEAAELILRSDTLK
jgi:hypothetical protein